MDSPPAIVTSTIVGAAVWPRHPRDGTGGLLLGAPRARATCHFVFGLVSLERMCPGVGWPHRAVSGGSVVGMELAVQYRIKQHDVVTLDGTY
ncbi:unnamed protein product [Calicophoron daubneyi]|uniref:Uncharacterized protein n=1 Tax=Calicophoron daubneyi TaxID=300641 RepID=A0AAV2T2F8_CALDB